MDIGEHKRTIIIEPLWLPLSAPAPEAEPAPQVPERHYEPVEEPEKVAP